MKSPLPTPTVPWVDAHGRPTQQFMQFLVQFAALNFGPLVSAANDAAAAAAGVQIGQLYQNSGVVQIRLT